MAIVRDTGVNQHETKTMTATGNTAVNVAAGDDRVLLVHLLLRSNALREISTITRNGRSDFLEIVRQDETSLSQDLRSVWFIQVAPDVGNYPVEVTFAASVQRWSVEAFAFRGVSQISPVGSMNVDVGTSGSAIALALSPDVGGCALIGGAIHETSTVLTLTNGTALQSNVEAGYVTATAYIIQDEAEDESLTWTAAEPLNFAASGFVLLPAGVIMLQPDDVTGIDTHLSPDSPDASHGTQPALQLRNTFGGLIRFPGLEDALPPDTTIEAAALILHQSHQGRFDSGVLSIYPILAANAGWSEASTHNHRMPTTQAWAGSAGCRTPGVDYRAEPSGSIFWPSTSPPYAKLSIPLTPEDVQEMAAGANYGWLLRESSEGWDWPAVWSSDIMSSVWLRPKLVITYGSGSGGGESLLSQMAHRWRDDEGNASWLADENDPAETPVFTPARLRVQVDTDGDQTSAQFRLEYRTAQTVIEDTFAGDNELWEQSSLPPKDYALDPLISSGVTVVRDGGQLTISPLTAAAGANGLMLSEPVDFRGGEATIHLQMMVPHVSDAFLTLALQNAEETVAIIAFDWGAIYASAYDDEEWGTLDEYTDETPGRWVRFRHDLADNRMYCEASVDGLTWESLGFDMPGQPFDLTAVRFTIYGGTYGTDNISGLSPAVADDFSLTLAASEWQPVPLSAPYLIPDDEDWDDDISLAWPMGEYNVDWDGGSWGGPSPCTLIKVGSTYYCYYAGHQGDGPEPAGEPVWRSIGVATSQDGITWTRYGNNPIVTYNWGGENIEEGVAGAVVIYRQGTWHLWYARIYGTGGDQVDLEIRYRSSTNGLDFPPETDTLVFNASGEEHLPAFGYYDPDAETWNLYTVGDMTTGRGDVVRRWGSSPTNLPNSATALTTDFTSGEGPCWLGDGSGAVFLYANNLGTAIQIYTVDRASPGEMTFVRSMDIDFDPVAVMIDEGEGRWLLIGRGSGELDPEYSYWVTTALLLSASPVSLAQSPHIDAGGADTTAQLSPPAGKTTNDFAPGRIQDDENPADSVTIGADSYTELEWSVQATVPGVYEFRVTIGSAPLDGYGALPMLTATEAEEEEPELVTPAAAEAGGATTTPAVLLGSLALSPSAAIVQGVASPPAVLLSSVDISPAAATTKGDVVSPVVQLGGLQVAPNGSTVAGATVSPAVRLGSILVAPAPITIEGLATEPAVLLGSLLFTPDAITARPATVSPAVWQGSIVFAPAPAAPQAGTVTPAVYLGSIVVEPPSVAATGAVDGPGIFQSGLLITAGPAAARATGANPVVLGGGGIFVTPAPVVANGEVVAPLVLFGGVAVAPTVAAAAAQAVPGIATLGNIAFVPEPIVAWAVAVAPAVGISGILLVPATASARVAGADPVIRFGGLVVVPVPAVVTGATLGAVVDGGIYIYTVSVSISRPGLGIIFARPGMTVSFLSPGEDVA